MNRLFPLLFALSVLAATVASGQYPATKDPSTAFKTAALTGRTIFLVFSGSDWCVSCIHFEKQVLRDSSFTQLARQRLIVLQADFPQHKKIADTLRTQYDALAQRFDREGTFPRIVLLNSDRQLLAELPYVGQPTPDFLRQLVALLN